MGNENWSLNRSDKRKIEAVGMRFFRPIAGYKLRYKKILSRHIREQLGIFNINDKLMQYKINLWNIYKEWRTTDYPKKLNYKLEDHKRDGKMISRRKEQAMGPKTYS